MATEEEPVQPKVEKSPKRLVGILVISVLIAGAAVTGTLLGPRLLAPRTPPVNEASESPDSGTEGLELEPSNPQSFAPIVVDVKSKRGEMHHMRVGITVEMADKVTKEDFERYQPRGREAAIGYLRSKNFDELTEPAEFENVTRQLNEVITRAMGEKRCARVVITDYVAQ